MSVALADSPDRGADLGGAVVDVEARAVGDRLELVERDVEPVPDGIRAGLDERIAASEAASARRRAALTATRCPASATSTGRSCT